MKFKKRYVLGEGYPWAYGTEPYRRVGLNKDRLGIDTVQLKFPSELWNEKTPKYKLVLEKIDE